MSPAEVSLPEPDRVTLFGVPLLWTLFRESTGYSAIEGLWGTSDLWPDRLRGNRGGEGRGGASLPFCNRATVQLPNPGLGLESWSRIEPGAVTGAVYCSLLQSPARQEL